MGNAFSTLHDSIRRKIRRRSSEPDRTNNETSVKTEPIQSPTPVLVKTPANFPRRRRQNPQSGPEPQDMSGGNGFIQEYMISYVENVGSGLFYAQCLSNKDKLMKLEVEMAYLYNVYWSNDLNHANPRYVRNPRINGFYACFDEDKTKKWLRCIMIENLSCCRDAWEGKLVKMQSIDYGFYIVVNTNAVYQLRQVYIDALPMQAMEARLFNADESLLKADADINLFVETIEKVKMLQVRYIERPYQLFPLLALNILENKADSGIPLADKDVVKINGEIQ